MKIDDICTYAPKSGIKAGEATKNGQYMFFTSSEDESKRYTNYLYDGEGIIMGTGGNATLHYYNGKYAVSTDCVVLNTDGRLRCKYLYYFFLANMAVLEAGFKGAGLKHTNKKYIGNISVPKIPSLDEQDRVIEALDKVSGIIQARTREIAILDDLSKARFVEMFGNLTDNTRLDKVELSEICEKITDGEHGSVARVPSGHPFLNAKHILKNGRIDWDTITYVSDEDHRRIYKRCNPEEGDILLTTTGTIGNIAIMPKSEEVSMDRGITLLKIDRQKVTSEFVAELLKQPSIQMEMGVNVHASAIGHLFINKVKKLPAVLPSLESQTEFTNFVRQVDKSKVI